MDLNSINWQEIWEIAAPILGIIAGIALIFLIIELILVLRRTRKTIASIEQDIAPTLQHVEKITSELQPAVARIDPLVERANLTVDALNLEIMRVDKILEDVGDITDGVSSATTAVSKIANAPVNLVNDLAERAQKVIQAGSASAESIALGAAKASVRDFTKNDESDAKSQIASADAALGATQADSQVAQGFDSESDEQPNLEYFTMAEPVTSTSSANGQTEDVTFEPEMPTDEGMIKHPYIEEEEVAVPSFDNVEQSVNQSEISEELDAKIKSILEFDKKEQ